MRHLPPSAWIAILLFVSSSGCVQKVAQEIAEEVHRIETQPSVDRPIRVAIDRAGSVRIDDGRPKRPVALSNFLRDRTQQVEAADLEPSEITIQISVDDATPYAKFARVVNACRESGFAKFNLVIAEHEFPFDLSPIAQLTPNDLQLPPLTVRLQANDDGELAGLALNDRQLTDVALLQIELIAIIGTDRGPGSIQEMAEIDLDCDDELEFRHVAAVYLAASGYDTDDGQRIALVETIWPVTGRPVSEIEQIDVLEEMVIDLPAAVITVEEFGPLVDPPITISNSPVIIGEVSVDVATDDAPATVDLRDSADKTPADSTPEAAEPRAPKREQATAAALQWLVNHQAPDGSWNFDHRIGGCAGRCRGQGTATTSTNAATAMAILPFLAAGQTHQQGDYKKSVGRGVAYLIRKAKPDKNGASFIESQGTMYSQGLATIALCETYRQTKDRQLEKVCQSALDFIGHAQDPVGGGWRYAPRQPGDTSVSGWQVAALTSGQHAGLTMPEKTLAGASRFLDTVQSDAGAKYGYTTPGAGAATSAIGLTSRIHLGGKRDDEAWQRGIDHLLEKGPSQNNMYFNFYATCAISQRGGEPWTKWYASVEKFLLDRQSDTAHEAGSWHMGAGHSISRGGRLYATSLATLILEISDHKLGIFEVGKAEP